MTKDEFFQLMASQGIEEALEQLTEEEQQKDNVILQLARLGKLKRDIDYRLVSFQTTEIQMNRIAHALFSLIKENLETTTNESWENEMEDIQKITAALRAYLNFFEQEENTAWIQEKEKRNAAFSNYVLSLQEEDFISMPETIVTDKAQLHQLLIKGKMLQVIKHLRVITKGTDLESEIVLLAKQYLGMFEAFSRGICDYEHFKKEESRVTFSLLRLIDSIEKKQRRNWWQKLWKR